MLIFLKLGGSLITKKDIPFCAREKTIKRIAEEIARAMGKNSNLKLLIGHGSGSFGHAAADQFGTRDGIHSQRDWQGFQEVWSAAHQLNQIVIEQFSKVGLPIISFPPSASLVTKNHKIDHWVTEPITAALNNNLLPIVFGDVVFDIEIGATICSTEELFAYLAPRFHPNQILLAGIEAGIFKDFPICQDMIKKITTATYPSITKYISASSSIDVTGGMASKVRNMFDIIKKERELSIHIFTGEKKDNIFKELTGETSGTFLCK